MHPCSGNHGCDLLSTRCVRLASAQWECACLSGFVRSTNTTCTQMSTAAPSDSPTAAPSVAPSIAVATTSEGSASSSDGNVGVVAAAVIIVLVLIVVVAFVLRRRWLPTPIKALAADDPDDPAVTQNKVAFAAGKDARPERIPLEDNEASTSPIDEIEYGKGAADETSFFAALSGEEDELAMHGGAPNELVRDQPAGDLSTARYLERIPGVVPQAPTETTFHETLV